MNAPEPEYLTPAEVAVLFRVAPQTVARWVKGGKFDNVHVIYTIGKHRRYKRADIEAIVRGGQS